jgi:hypothetical protein
VPRYLGVGGELIRKVRLGINREDMIVKKLKGERPAIS